MLESEIVLQSALMGLRYKHNCSICEFLGRWNEFDLYFHNSTFMLPAPVVRCGNNSDDALAGPRYPDKYDHPAICMARKAKTRKIEMEEWPERLQEIRDKKRQMQANTALHPTGNGPGG